MAIIYDVGFNVQTSTLTNQLKTINNDINKAFELRSKGELGKEVEKGVVAASQLKAILQSATTDKGLSLIALNNGLKQANTSAAELVKNLSGAGMTGALNTFVTAFTTADRTVLTLNKRVQEMSRVLTQSFKFSIAQQSLRFLQSTFNSGIQWAEDMNSALTNISIVTGKTGQDLDAVFKTITNGAAELRVAAREYAEASLIFYQQGLGDEEVARRTEITIKAAKAAGGFGASVEQMSKELTAVWNTYGMVNDELERAASISAKLGAETAVDMSYISEAMQIAATAAAQMGVEYESLASIIATTGEVTLQSASVVGNAFKTIFSRFQQLKSDGTDGEVTLGLISSQLQQLGINVLDASGELRDLDSVIQEVGTSWESYSQKQQLAIAQLVGGTRQYTQFLALMQNFGRYQENLASAQSEVGGETLERQYQTYLKSLESLQEQSAEAWNKVFGTIVNEDALKAFYTTLRDIAKLVQSIVDGAGGLQGILGYISAIVISQLGPKIENIAYSLTQMSQNATFSGRFEAANNELDAMINKLNQAADIQRVLTTGGYELSPATSGEINSDITNSATVAKLEMTKELLLTQMQLTEIQKEGNAAEQVAAEFIQGEVTKKQQLYNLALDEAAAIDRKVAAQKELNDAISQQHSVAQQYNAEQQAFDSIANSLIDNINKVKTAARAEGGVIPKDALDSAKVNLNELATNLQKFTSESSAELGTFGNKMAETLEKLDNGTISTKNALNELTEAYRVLAQDAATSPTTSIFDVDLTNVEDNINNIRAMGDSIEDTANKASDLRVVIEEADNVIAGFSGNTVNLTQEFSTAAGSLVAVTTGFTNLSKAISQGNVSFSTLLISTVSIATGLTKLVKVIQTFRAAQAAQAAQTALVNGLIAQETSLETLKTLAKAAGIAVTDKSTKADIIQAAVKAGLITATNTETGAVVINTAAKSANLAVTAALAVAALAAVAVTLAIVSAIKKQTEARIAANKELIAEFEAAKELRAEQESLIKTYKSALSTYKEVNEQYREGTASATQLKDAQDALSDAADAVADSFEIKGIALMELTGNYEALTAAIREYQQAEISAALDSSPVTQAAAASNFKDAMKSGKGWESAFGNYNANFGSFSDFDANASEISRIINSYSTLSTGIVGSGESMRTSVELQTKSTTDGLVKTYEEVMAAIAELSKLEDIGSNYVYQQLVDWAAKSQEEYEILQGILGDIEDLNIADIASGLDSVDNIENLRQFQQYRDEYLQASMDRLKVDPNDTLEIQRVTAAVDQYLSTVAGLEGVAKANQGLMDLETLGYDEQQIQKAQDIYEMLEANDQAHLFWQISFEFDENSWEDQLLYIQQRADTATVEVKLQTVMDAQGLLSENMDAEGMKKLQNSGIEWGKEGVIEFNQFLQLTYAEQTAYLQNMQLELRNSLISSLQESQAAAAQLIESNGVVTDEMYEIALNRADEIRQRMKAIQQEIEESGLTDELENELNELEEELPEIELTINTRLKADELQQEIDNYESEIIIQAQREIDMAKALIEDARSALESVSSGSFVGTVYEQVAALKELNQQMELLNLPPLTEDFLTLTSAEQEQVLALVRLSSAQKEYNEIAEVAGATSVDAQVAMKNLTVATADAFNIDSDNLQIYARHIQEVAKQSDLLADSLSDNQKAALDVATATIRANRAFIDLDGKIDDIKKAFQEADIASERFSDAIQDIRGPMEDLLNVDPGSLSIAFLSSIENLDLLQEAVDGNIDALWELQQIAAGDIFGQIFSEESTEVSIERMEEIHNSLLQMISDIDEAAESGWQLGETLNDLNMDESVDAIYANVAEIVAGMQAMGASAQDVQNYFNSMGLKLEGETHTEKVKREIPTTATQEVIEVTNVPISYPQSDGTTITGNYPVVRKWVETSPSSYDEEVEQEVFSLTGEDGNGGLTLTNTGSAGTSAGRAMRSTPNRGSGGKGTGSPGSKGGGGGKDKTITANQTDVTQRYRDINDALTEVTRRLDRVSSAADKAFGMNRVRLLTQQNALIQQQARLYQQLQKEAENYLRVNAGLPVQFGNGFISGEGGDQGVLQAMLATFGLSANFGSGGAVSNAEQLLSQLTNIAQAKLEEIGTFVDGVWEIANEDAKESYELLTGMISSIESQIGKVGDTAQQIADAFDKQVESIHTWLSNEIQAVEYKLELRLSINAMDLRRLEFLLNRLGDRAFIPQMDLIDEMASNAIKDAKELIGSYEELNGIIDKINTGDMLTKEEFMSTFGGNIEAWNQFLESGGAYTQEMMDTLMAKAGQMQDVIEKLYSYSEQMFSAYHTALNLYIEDFDRLISVYDSHASMLDSWSNIWRVAGQPWRNQRLQVDLLNKSIDTQSSKVQGLQQKYEFLNQELANAEEHYRLAVETHGADDKIAQESLANLKLLQSQINEAQADFLSGVSEMMNMIEQAAAEAAQVIVNEFVEGLGGLFSEVDSALAMLAQKTSIDKFFLHEEDLEFELNKLLREIAKEMEGATNPELLANYEAWMEKVNELKESGAQLTQTELDILKAEFDLEKARAAWQESQANKNTLRLSRDASGNWNYVYSNDGSDDGDAEADIEQRIHNIRKMHRDAADEAAEMWLQVWAEYNKYIQEIDWQRYEQNEAYRKEVDTRMAWYEQQMDLYAVQIEKHNDAIDRSFTEMSLSVILDIDNMAEANDRYKQNNQEMTEALKRNHDEYQEKARETLEAVGISYEDLEATINRETAIIMAKNKENEESVKRLRETAHAELNAIMQKTAEWSQRWINEIQAVINKLNELIAKILEMQAAQAGSSGTDGNYLNYNSGTYDTLKAKETAGSLTPDEAAFLAELRMINEARSRGDTTWDNYSNSAEFLKKQREFYAKYPEYQYTYDTGGLATGPQIAGLALDGKKELVLKNEDTENILAAVAMQRASLANRFNGLGSRYNEALTSTNKAINTETAQPPVIIQADFPNVSARDEIEAAFNNLVNQAAQYEIKPRE